MFINIIQAVPTQTHIATIEKISGKVKVLKSDELSDEISFLKSELQKASVREQQIIHYFEVREQELLQRIKDLEAKNKMWWPW